MDRAWRIHVIRKFRFGDSNEDEVLAAQHAHYEEYWRHREDSFVSPPERLLTEVRVLEYRLQSNEEKRLDQRNGGALNAVGGQKGKSKGKGKAKGPPVQNFTKIDDGGLVGKENTKIVFDEAEDFEAGARDETSILVDSEDEEMSEGEMTRLWKEVQDEGDSGVLLPQIQEDGSNVQRRAGRPPPTRIQPERSTRNGNASGWTPVNQLDARLNQQIQNQQAQNQPQGQAPTQLQNRTQIQSQFSDQSPAQHQLPPRPPSQPILSNTYIMCVSPHQAAQVLGVRTLPPRQYPRMYYLTFRSQREHANKTVKIGWGPHKGREVDSMAESWKEATINKPRSKYYFVPEQPTGSRPQHQQAAQNGAGTSSGAGSGGQNGNQKKGPKLKPKSKAKKAVKAKARRQGK